MKLFFVLKQYQRVTGGRTDGRSDTLLSQRSVSARVTRKPNCRWLTRAMRKHAKNCSNSICLQRCRWQYWS